MKQQEMNPQDGLLHLAKGCQHFYFRWEPGAEGALLDAIVEMVSNREVNFDWFDAAVISNQIGKRMAAQLREYHE